MRAVTSGIVAAAALLPLCPGLATAGDPPPKSLDRRVEIRLFADAPQIVTPTGIAVDDRGRVWAIESNTHFRPHDYKGYPSDRVLVFSDRDGDGRADRIDTFADGFTYAMSVAVPFGDGVYVATRNEVIHLADTNGDGKADTRQVILRLETAGNYPHNGLAGFAFDGLGNLYIGLGENLGADYRLVGTDGRSHSGGGEGGGVFRCRTDGTGLTLWATGFWNPHDSCIDAFGRMFTVDNDPDDRPPCRLLNLIPGGDYGYRFRNGRRGIHPFTAWDGELPGTLPMASGTGEAPSGIVAYESDGLPDDYRGSLLATSWGDHRIDRFRLVPHGTSLASQVEPIIVGGDHFRPVGLALAPDGSLFATDWVLKDYFVHGNGRIWQIVPAHAASARKPYSLAELPRWPVPALRQKLDSPRMDVRRVAARTLAQRDRQFLSAFARNEKSPARGRMEAIWALARQNRQPSGNVPQRSTLKNPEIELLWPDLENVATEPDGETLLARLRRPWALNPSRELVRLVHVLPAIIRTNPKFLDRVLAVNDHFVFAATVQALTNQFSLDEFAERLRAERNPSPRVRLAFLVAARQSDRDGSPDRVISIGLQDPDFTVRRTAVQWIGEERLRQFRGDIEQQLSDSTTTADLFEATLASLEMLDGLQRTPGNEFSGADYALRLANDDQASPSVRAMALRMVPPDFKKLGIGLLRRLIGGSVPVLRFEAVRTLRDTAYPQAAGILRSLVAAEHTDRNLRLEAVTGLAVALERDPHDTETIRVLRALLVGPDHSLQIAALRALRHLLQAPEIRNDVSALAASVARAQKPTDDVRELADQLAIAKKTSPLAVTADLHRLTTPRPQSLDGWIRLVAEGGDPREGRRVFEHPNSGYCWRCHTVNGRGGRIGPDLSIIARSIDRRKLVESILEPSKEIAPQYTSWTFVLHDGRMLVGLVVEEDREGHLVIGTPDGKLHSVEAADVEERRPQSASIMPDRLIESMTVGEFRDLVAFLATLK